MHAVPLEIAYLDGPRLLRSVRAAANWVEAGREHLNRINVFPVPDGDTGTNFASTLRAVADSATRLGPAPLDAVVTTMAQAGILAAQGNSGMLLSQFLLGFRKAIGDRHTAKTDEIARALRVGSDQVAVALDEPVEGTILTVARDVADAAERLAAGTKNVAEFMRLLVAQAQASLNRTPELLAVLRESGVVDAGAGAFVRMLEGVVRLIDGDSLDETTEEPPPAVPHAAAAATVAIERDYQYCTEVLVKGQTFPAATEVRAHLRDLGGSIVVLATEELLKLHIHTDTPQQVFDLARTWGIVESKKMDDMRQQHERLHDTRRRITIVLDSSCDLPDELVDRHGMIVVPLQVICGDERFLDRVELRGKDLYDRMRNATVPFTTSQPTPGALLRAFEDARADADQALGIFVSGAVSGTLASAELAARASELDGITVVDSRTASLGLGLLALLAAELAEAGRSLPEIQRELQRVRDQSGAMFTVDTFENLLRSGRVSRGKAWLGGLLDLKPILEVDSGGRVVPLGRVRGREALIPWVLDQLESRLTPRPKSLRLGVTHADAPDAADELRAELVRRYQPRDCLVTDATAAIGVHTGPGAWAVFYQIED